jgi:hypothetical protein
MTEAFDNYISSLEGKENLDPVKIAQELQAIHNHEVETRDASLSERDSAIAERDSTLAEREAEVTRYKAMNFDLTQRIPANNQGRGEQFRDNLDPNTPDGRASTIGPDDLFE